VVCVCPAVREFQFSCELHPIVRWFAPTAELTLCSFPASLFAAWIGLDWGVWRQDARTSQNVAEQQHRSSLAETESLQQQLDRARKSAQTAMARADDAQEAKSLAAMQLKLLQVRRVAWQ